jgi:DNA-directed RNA polymerase specialized sigma54-like protein
MGNNILKKVKVEYITTESSMDKDVFNFINDRLNDNGYFWLEDVETLMEDYGEDETQEVLNKVDTFFKEMDLYGTDLKVDYE